jgi:hypothetical protein
MADGNSSFEAAIKQRAREIVEQESKRRHAELERAAAEQVQVLEYAAKDKTAEIHWTSAQQREAINEVAGARSAELEAVSARIHHIADVVTGALQELEQTATAEAKRLEEGAAAGRDDMRRTAAEEAAAFEQLAGKRLAELEAALRVQFDTFRGELVGEAHRVHNLTEERVNQTQSRIERHAAASGDDVRRVAAAEAQSFDDLARKRVAELQAILHTQNELLDEFHRLEASTNDRLAALDEAGKRQMHAIAESVAEAAEGLKDTSASEVRRIAEHASRFGHHAETRLADLQRLSAQFRQFEGSAAQRLQKLEREIGDRRGDVDGTVETRIRALTQQVERTEAELQRRIAELHAHGTDARLDQAVAAATAEFDAVVTARTRHFEASAAKVRAAAKDDIVGELRRVEAALAEARTTQTAELGEMVSAARSLFEQVATSRIEGMESIAGSLRAGIEELHSDIASALQETGEAQSAALDRAATSWLTRIERAGRKRGRTGWRHGRAAPSATAVILAIAAAVGGTLMVRGGGNDRSSVADASAPRRARPATAAEASPTTTAPPATDAQPQPDGIHWTAPGQPQTQQPPASGAPASPTASRAPSGTAGPASPSPQSPSSQPAPEPQPPPQEQPPSGDRNPVCDITGIC